MELKSVPLELPEGCNIIIGHSHNTSVTGNSASLDRGVSNMNTTLGFSYTAPAPRPFMFP